MKDPGRALALVFFWAQILWLRVGGQSLLEDGAALEAFLTEVLHNHNYNSSDTSPCDWNPPRVQCQNSRISGLNFSGFHLVGAIGPNALSNLTELIDLNLSLNNLTGFLPVELSRLTQLRTLKLARNNFSGEPRFIANLNQLQELDLSGNKLEGDVLEAVRGSNLIESLNLSDNRFTGNISTIFQVLRNLQFIDLTRNSFTGLIPNEICSSQTLATLHLGSNNFTGQIPTSLEPCSSLQSLNLSSNSLNGTIPEKLNQTRSLRELDLGRNFLNGPLPPSIFGPPELRMLNLHFNNLSGQVSVPNGAGVKLTEVNLESNRFSGLISPALLEFRNLTILKLGNNSFSGSLPTAILNGASELRELDLHSNNLSGRLPGLGGGLMKIDFSSNFFEGGLQSVPQGLQVLDMHNNSLTGVVPPLSQSLTYLDLSSNSFTGDFPSNFSHLLKLTGLSLADNKFSSHSFPFGLSSVLEVLNLSRTNLSGILPPTISDFETTIKLIDLSSNNLTGKIPVEMSQLHGLEILDLSDNKLQGKIPPEMINLTSLSRLNLSNNNLTGEIPHDNQWLTFLNTSFLGNGGLCGRQLSKPCPENQTSEVAGEKLSSGSRTGLIIGSATGLAALLIVALSLFIWCRVSMTVKPIPKDETTGKHVSGPVFFEDPETWASGIKDPQSISVVMFEKPLLNLTFADLLDATANFNKELQIADGGYGPVYKGIMRDGTQLAIKVLVEVQFDDGGDAVAQIEALAKIKHPNLVALVGYCLVGDDSLLLYEYMVNGDLQRWLHELPEGTHNPEDWSRDTWEHMEGDEISGDFLRWPTRLKIALGTARALAFLHHGCSPHVVHRDVKSSNILLDESFDAHLVECGLAGIANPTTLVIGGTVGYVPPEYGQTWEATPRGDVYSFGVVLLELVTGKKPTGHYFQDSYGGNLVGWVRFSIKDKGGLKALDPKLASSGDVNQMLEVLRVGYLCTAEAAPKRPTMQQVVGMLKDCQPGT